VSEPLPPLLKLYWDFWGPHAERTAVHFEKHLQQFLANNGHAEVPVGNESAHSGHHAAFCVIPNSLLDAIKQSLRPNRVLPG
jgi:type II secretory pathway component PulM